MILSPRKSAHPGRIPRIQAAGVSSLEESLFCAGAGVDSLGFTLELPTGLHDGLTVDKVAAIIPELPSDLIAVIITYLTSARAASNLLHRTAGRAVQFHGGISPSELLAFRSVCPHVTTIGMVTVSGPESIERAAQFGPPLWDAIILDSLDPATGKTGATGMVHDWTLSARIVKMSPVPVILAGGLNPDNVEEAVMRVRPDGVDAHTGLEDSDGTRNFDKIRDFARAADTALKRIGR
jgi:phosphoribosylanthranilate isomerase